MENTLQSSIPQDNSARHIFPLLIAAALGLLCYLTYHYVQQTQKDRVNMEKSSGRNGKHSNPKAKSKAEEQYQKVEEELKALESKAGKTAEEAKRVKELKRLKKHWRDKKDWGGEHHSQKHKGN